MACAEPNRMDKDINQQFFEGALLSSEMMAVLKMYLIL